MVPSVVRPVTAGPDADRRLERRAAGHRAREPEVEQPRAGSRHHHVARLQIAVHDPGAMRRRERVRDLDAVFERLRHAQRATLEPRGERLALEQLHHQERVAFVLADVVERTDVRMLES